VIDQAFLASYRSGNLDQRLFSKKSILMKKKIGINCTRNFF